MLRLPQNKIVYNSLITSLNRMNQSFTFRQEYNILETKFNYIDFLWFFQCCLPTSFLGLLGHNFCSWAPIEIKITYPWSSYKTTSLQKVSNNYITTNSENKNLHRPKLSPQETNGLLGLKGITCITPINLQLLKIYFKYFLNEF